MESDKKNKLDFKPVTTGLGFHPFSDGLPYAPHSKAAKTPVRVGAAPVIGPAGAGGAGAIAAGPARPVLPTTRFGANVKVPVARTAQTEKIIKAPIVQSPLPESALSQFGQLGEFGFGYVYLLKRSLAFTIDSLINLSLCAAALSTVLMKQDVNPDLLFNSGVVMIAISFLAFFNWALITAQEISFGTSVGKRVLGLTLEGSTSTIFLRALFFLPSFGLFGIGLLWALFDPKCRCWHDKVAGIQPIELARL